MGNGQFWPMILRGSIYSYWKLVDLTELELIAVKTELIPQQRKSQNTHKYALREVRESP